jgi:uncharacterized membrane protein YfcA
MLVYVYGGRTSTGVLMPLLIAADLMAITYYRKNVHWKFLGKMLPTTVIGVLVGTYIGKDLPEDLFKKGMAAIILLSVVIMFAWERYDKSKVPYCGLVIFYDKYIQITDSYFLLEICE